MLQPNPFADVIRRLSAARDPACLLDEAGNYLFVNDAWDGAAPARDPGASAGALVGRSWLDGFEGEEVRRLHAEFLFQALRAASGTRRGTRRRSEIHIVERNTPTSGVLVAMKMEPVVLDGGPVAVAITHVQVRERPIEDVYPVVERGAEEYRDGAGAVTQCTCCRRLRDPREEERWDLVPAAVEHPPRGAAQALCGLCRELHYGQLVAG